jgi:hypothetical protein
MKWAALAIVGAVVGSYVASYLLLSWMKDAGI